MPMMKTFIQKVKKKLEDLSGRARNTEEDKFEHVLNNFTANLAASPELHCIIDILLLVLLFSNPFFFTF